MIMLVLCISIYILLVVDGVFYFEIEEGVGRDFNDEFV